MYSMPDSKVSAVHLKLMFSDHQRCTCGDPCENVEHYFLHCNNFTNYSNK